MNHPTIDANGSNLTLHIFRTARDLFGVDCAVFGGRVQVAAWETLALIIGQSQYSKKEVERQRSYWLGPVINLDPALPEDEIMFFEINVGERGRIIHLGTQPHS